MLRDQPKEAVMQRIIAAASFLIATTVANAATISFDVPEAETADAISQTYDCRGEQVLVVYHNAGPVSLAVLTIGGETVVASNVIAASGARYAGAQYVWWTKGDGADLYDLMQGEDAPPVACRVLAE
jgi:membrane-bound inhibitor of C-type lysozyme